jgi:quercetin dioxygenase-like cupin family protein
MTDAPTRRAGLEIHRMADATPLVEAGLMSMPTMDPPAYEQLGAWAQAGGQDVRVLFCDPEGSGMSLVWARFAPGFMLPRHSHSGDCLYFVHRGELRMGNTVLHPGDSFFLSLGAPYAYTAGPEGVEVLEFRKHTELDRHISESLGRWDQIVANAQAHSEAWAAEAAARA